MTHQSDDSLLIAVHERGDRQAFAELYRRHADAARGAAYRIAPRLDKDDVVSEAFTRILQAIENGNGPREAFRPYLYQTVRSVCVDHSKQHAAEGDRPLDDEFLVDPTARDLAEMLDEHTRVGTALSTLSPRLREVLWYTEVEGLPPRAVAPLLGLTPNHVSQLRRRANDQLRLALESDAPVNMRRLHQPALNRGIAIAMLGGLAPTLLPALFGQQTAAVAATVGAPVTAQSALTSRLALIGGSLLAASAVVIAAFLLLLPTPNDTASEAQPETPLVTEERADPEPAAEEPEPIAEPVVPPVVEQPAPAAPSPTPTPAEPEATAPSLERDPGPWVTLPEQEPVIRGPVSEEEEAQLRG